MGSGCQGRKVSMVQEVQGMMCVGGGGKRHNGCEGFKK